MKPVDWNLVPDFTVEQVLELQRIYSDPDCDEEERFQFLVSMYGLPFLLQVEEAAEMWFDELRDSVSESEVVSDYVS